jgi:hypothetical protein
MYHTSWRNFWRGFNYRYGSGTPVREGAFRLPTHSTTDLADGITLWQGEPQKLDFEFNLVNITDNMKLRKRAS